MKILFIEDSFVKPCSWDDFHQQMFPAFIEVTKKCWAKPFEIWNVQKVLWGCCRNKILIRLLENSEFQFLWLTLTFFSFPKDLQRISIGAENLTKNHTKPVSYVSHHNSVSFYRILTLIPYFCSIFLEVYEFLKIFWFFSCFDHFWPTYNFSPPYK